MPWRQGSDHRARSPLLLPNNRDSAAAIPGAVGAWFGEPLKRPWRNGQDFNGRAIIASHDYSRLDCDGCGKRQRPPRLSTADACHDYLGVCGARRLSAIPAASRSAERKRPRRRWRHAVLCGADADRECRARRWRFEGVIKPVLSEVLKLTVLPARLQSMPICFKGDCGRMVHQPRPGPLPPRRQCRAPW